MGRNEVGGRGVERRGGGREEGGGDGGGRGEVGRGGGGVGRGREGGGGEGTGEGGGEGTALTRRKGKRKCCNVKDANAKWLKTIPIKLNCVRGLIVY